MAATGAGPLRDALRPLDPNGSYKPLDASEAGVSVSVDAHGRLVTVSQGHPEHGVVTMSAHAPFPASARHDQAAVRRWRRRLSARDAAAFGLRPVAAPGPAPPLAARAAWLAGHALPVTGLVGVARPALATFVPNPDDVDGPAGGRLDYHDANDLPMALAAAALWDGGAAGGQRPAFGSAALPAMVRVARRHRRDAAARRPWPQRRYHRLRPAGEDRR
jgi:hypothetical protein